MASEDRPDAGRQSVMGWLGHDPGRLRTLARRVAVAAEELATITSAEPAAAVAVAAVTAVESQLRLEWLPLLGRVLADTTLTEWLASTRVGGFTVLVPQPPPGGAGGVAAWWQSLSTTQQQIVVVMTPAAIGNRNGVPASARDQANRSLLADDLARLSHAESAGTLSDDDAARLANARAIDESLADGAAFTDPRTGDSVAVQLYRYEPAALGGDGRAAIALGDADTADHLAIIVPGMGTEVSSFGTAAQQSVFTATGEHTTAGIAVMTWVGYDAPSLSVPDGSDDNPLDDATDWVVESSDLTDVAGMDAATAGAGFLAADVAAIRAVRGDAVHLTVIGNSYGSTTVAIAADEFELDTDDVILTGSPGAGRADDAADLTTGRSNTWVGSASDDPITYLGRTGGAEPHDVIDVAAGAATIDVDVGLGNDPAEDDFGAQRFQAEWPGRDHDFPWPLAGHGHYFDPHAESVGNVGAIVAGDYGAVRLAEHRHKDESWDLWDPFGDLLPVDPEADQPVD
jgi:Alpha/beta hydrolase